MPLVARIGSTNQVIGTALLVITAAMIIRAVGNVPLLYFSSLTIGITIAILNFSLPVWVKENVSGHSGLITGIYITLMGGFANIAIAVTVPLATATSWGMAAFNGAVDCDWNLFISLVVFTQCQNANSDSHSGACKISQTITPQTRSMEHCTFLRLPSDDGLWSGHLDAYNFSF